MDVIIIHYIPTLVQNKLRRSVGAEEDKESCLKSRDSNSCLSPESPNFRSMSEENEIPHCHGQANIAALADKQIVTAV